MAAPSIGLADALGTLERDGLLLLSDTSLPSLAALVAGEPIRGSWWGHRSGAAIFAVATELDAHADVATAKLLGGKVTFVHRRLFATLASVGAARAPWQTAGLDEPAAALLARVIERGTERASGAPVKLLETRLLCASREVHTRSGAHVTELSAWSVFARERGFAAAPEDAGASMSVLERVRDGLVAGSGGSIALPWEAPLRGRRKGRAR